MLIVVNLASTNTDEEELQRSHVLTPNLQLFVLVPFSNLWSLPTPKTQLHPKQPQLEWLLVELIPPPMPNSPLLYSRVLFLEK